MNLLKLSFRFLKNHLKYTLLNVFGLAIGISAAYILFGYAYFHMSFDDFHPDLDSKYRVLMPNHSILKKVFMRPEFVFFLTLFSKCFHLR